jgi:hypothetical protein
MQRVRRLVLGGLALATALTLGAGPAGADGTVLHEFIPNDPAEDLALRATPVTGVCPPPSTRRVA